MRRDKVLNNLKQMSPQDIPNYDALKNLFRTLSSLFKTVHLGELLEKAETCSKVLECNDDFVKFF